MTEWDFRIKLLSKETEMRFNTVGMDFETALGKAVKAMVEEGRPWAENDVAEIYHEPLLGWLGNPKKRRPLLTFMPPVGMKEEK